MQPGRIEDKTVPVNPLGFIHTQSQLRCDETNRFEQVHSHL